MTKKNTIVKYTLSQIKKQIAQGKSKTRPDAPEGKPLGKAFWKRAKVVMPHETTSVRLRVDSDIYTWFKKQGGGHLMRMNAALRSYVDSHRN